MNRLTTTNTPHALALIGTFFLAGIIIGQAARATTPEQINIDEILGNSSELFIRRSGRRESIEIGSILQRMRDDLITSPPNNARALLRFLSAEGEDLNLFIQTNPHPEPAIYYFPCQVNGGNSHIGWGLAQNESRGCENGMQVTHRPSTQAQGASWLTAQASQETDGLDDSGVPPHKQFASDEPQWFAQGRVRQVFYCSTVGHDGAAGFATSMSSDPCIKALEECQTVDGVPCESAFMGSWWTHEEAVHAALRCVAPLSNTDLVVEPVVHAVDGSGDAIASQIESTLAEFARQGCQVQVYRPQDFVMVPAPDEDMLALGDDSILVQTRNTAEGLEVDVLEGAVNVYSTNRSEPQLVTQGQRYVHSTSGSRTVTSFDRETALTSVDMEVLCTFASNQDKTLDVPACAEADLYVPTIDGQVQLAFCNREQGSGGQEGDRRTVQMSTNQGEITLEYETFQIPDRFQLIYEGRQILDTGFISGSNELTIPFSGRSGRVDVIVTGNQSDSTQWNYTLQCP
ncbi:MAG: hypothetical protein F6K16_38465 [Symploca sp. SIO2B6]|nr:hypothetical protein [Symploca sp. SIO2B6]